MDNLQFQQFCFPLLQKCLKWITCYLSLSSAFDVIDDYSVNCIVLTKLNVFKEWRCLFFFTNNVIKKVLLGDEEFILFSILYVRVI